MIIESGIDVIQVLCGSVSNADPHGLWIIAMDENLRLLFIDPLASETTGDMEEHADVIEQFLDDWSEIRYFVLAWSTDVVRQREPQWLTDLDDIITAMPQFAGRRLLGQIVFDPNTMFASVPRCDFSLEPQLADLPRALSILGPHGLDCGCPPCREDRRAFDDSYGSDGSDGSDGSYGPYGDDADSPYGDGSYGGGSCGDGSYGDGSYGTYRDDADYREGEPYSPTDVPVYPFEKADFRYDAVNESDLYPRRPRQRRRARLGARGRFPVIEPFPQLAGFAEPRFDPFTRRWFPEPARARKRWTFDEEVAVAQSHFAGLSCFDISILMHRQPSAIASRLNKLGISSSTGVISIARA